MTSGETATLLRGHQRMYFLALDTYATTGGGWRLRFKQVIRMGSLALTRGRVLAYTQDCECGVPLASAKNLLSHPEDFANSNPVSGDTNHGTRGFWSASSGRILRADRDELMQFYRRHNGTELPFWYKTPSGECVRAHFAGDVESNLLAPGIYDYSVDIEELRP